MKAIAGSCPGHLIKSQQREDPDLTSEEKEAELEKIFAANPTAFLRRFRSYLNRDHLSEVRQRRGRGGGGGGGGSDDGGGGSSSIVDYEMNFLMDEILEELDERKRKTKIKNRRFNAMKSLGDEEDFFR